jgi:hypothetical protein
MIRMNALTPMPSANDADPLGADAELAMARAIERLAATRQSTAELLQQLRREFPDAPLAFRVRALEALRRR